MATWDFRVDEAMEFLRRLPAESIDALITDPPYSSGGAFKSDRAMAPSAKYVQWGTQRKHMEFQGDNRDQRSWTSWAAEWLRRSMRALRPGGYALVFTDWRQLPALTDAFQWAGLNWRGVIGWDKGRGARAPHKGYFKHQLEYVVWGTRGACPVAAHGGPFDGCYAVPVKPREKFHMTGKPIELMSRLVECIPPGGVVLDPFAGSGSTGVAALTCGRNFVGCELSAEYADIAVSRLEKIDGAERI